MRPFILFPVALVVVGCATPVPSVKDNPVTARAHKQVVAELRADDRRPASPPPELGARLADLNRVRPGRFEVYVFPRLNNQNMKERLRTETYLGRPQVFEFSTVAQAPCRQFISGGMFRNLRAGEAFPAALGEGQRTCAILEVTSKKLREADRALLRRDDLMKIRLFLDDAYRVHATDHTFHDGGGRTRDVRILNEEGVASAVNLGLFPVDLPGEGARFSPTNPGSAFPNLDRIAVYQINRRLRRGFSPPSCRGGVFDYSDGTGGPARVGWCQGLPWPSFIENPRFLSVTEPLSL